MDLINDFNSELARVVAKLKKASGAERDRQLGVLSGMHRAAYYLTGFDSDKTSAVRQALHDYFEGIND